MAKNFSVRINLRCMMNQENKLKLLKKKNEAATKEYEEHTTHTEKSGIVSKLIWKLSYPIRYLNNNRAIRDALDFNKNGLNKTEKREKKIVVSLTSYPARIDVVPATIGSLLRQTVKPDCIVLWLGEEKFPNQELPKIYEKLRECGVEIRFRQDLKSHTKYFYAIQEFPEDIIITVDDDLLYRETLIEELYSSYKKHPECVSALRVHKMRFNDDYTLKKYGEWYYEYSGEIGSISHQYFATGVGGVLYPPHVLHPEVTNLDVIRKCCHNHDDLWLKIMEVMNGTKVALAADSKKKNKGQIMGTQATGQWKENVIDGGNDRQTEAVLTVYNNYFSDGWTLNEIMALDK